jgi:hypothetical protein
MADVGKTANFVITLVYCCRRRRLGANRVWLARARARHVSITDESVIGDDR